MIRAVQWASYGDVDVPFPAPQVSNANLTAVVRFDGDNSGDLNYQLKTLNFLTGVAQDTGVVPLYTWVSSFVKKAGWDKLGAARQAPRGSWGRDRNSQQVPRNRSQNDS